MLIFFTKRWRNRTKENGEAAQVKQLHHALKRLRLTDALAVLNGEDIFPIEQGTQFENASKREGGFYVTQNTMNCVLAVAVVLFVGVPIYQRYMQ